MGLFGVTLPQEKLCRRDQALPFSVKSGWRRPRGAAHFDGGTVAPGWQRRKGRLSSKTRTGCGGVLQGGCNGCTAQMYKDDSILINKTYNKEPYEPTSPIECSTFFFSALTYIH